MKPDEDPTADIYKLMDEAGLDAGTMLDSKMGMSQIVSKVRTQMAQKFKSYIVRRDHQMFNAGRKSTEPKKIDVKEKS